MFKHLMYVKLCDFITLTGIGNADQKGHLAIGAYQVDKSNGRV